MDRQFQSSAKDTREPRDSRDTKDSKDSKDSKDAAMGKGPSLIHSIITFVLLFIAWLAWRDSKRLKKVFEKQGSCDPLAAGEIYNGLKKIELFTLLLWSVPIVMGILIMIFVMSRFKKQKTTRKADSNGDEDERNSSNVPPPPQQPQPMHCFPMPPVHQNFTGGLYGRYYYK